MLQQLIAFQISLDEFDAWLAKASWNMQQDSDADSVKLVGQIEGRIAEFEQGHISEGELYREFERIDGILRIGSDSKVCVVASGSVTSDQPREFQFGPLPDAGKRLELEFWCALPLPG